MNETLMKQNWHVCDQSYCGTTAQKTLTSKTDTHRTLTRKEYGFMKAFPKVPYFLQINGDGE